MDFHKAALVLLEVPYNLYWLTHSPPTPQSTAWISERIVPVHARLEARAKIAKSNFNMTLLTDKQRANLLANAGKPINKNLNTTKTEIKIQVWYGMACSQLLVKHKSTPVDLVQYLASIVH